MDEKKPLWTNEQMEAITDESSDILVSAAAGSGKTAVLTERLIRKITDPISPIDVNRILVVTFTEDAANELKLRIRDAISKAMAEYPSNKHLQRQYLMLSGAKISTIHGFCLDLIKRNYELLGLSPKLRVSDEAQNSLLMQQVADTVVDGYYSSLPGYDDITDFVTFADNFITLQDSSLTAKIIDIYKKLQSFSDGIDFLKKSAEMYPANEDFTGSIWNGVLCEHVKRVFSFYLTVYEDACAKISEYDEISDKYLPVFESGIIGIKAIINAAETKDYETLKNAVDAYDAGKIGSKKDYVDDETLLFFKSVRAELSAEIKKIKERFFSFTPEILAKSSMECREYVSDLYKLLSAFDRRFSLEKRRRGIIDFNDMERLAYALLVRSDGSYTELASELASQYDEVCIDEYQDVNELQDAIFKAITRMTNRFMVGDIKQSIYGFRGAEPKIFADYRLDDSVKLISLTHNFRSDNPVIQISNEICGNLFRKYGDTVPYDKSDELYFANGSTENQQPEIVVIENNDIKDTEDDDADADEHEDSVEATYAAKRINELVWSGVKPSDIAILLRSAKKEAKVFESALSKYGIMSKNKEQKDLFANAEVMLLMCLLNIIDNPKRDIYLAGALKSPIYNFTLSELAVIRRYDESSSLYDALKKYTEEQGFSKGEYFLNKLKEYRKLSNEPVDKLIWHIFNDTGLLGYASANDNALKGGKANLMKLYEKARSFESGSFKGLYNFIRYINDMLDSDTEIPSPSNANDSNTVQIMTIHKSKGLQFKYVFICGTSKRFNTRDENSDIIIDKRFGTTLKLSDESGLATVDTLFRRASAISLRKKNFEEEIRVLYVALTRAKSKLVIVGSVNSFDKLDDLMFYRCYIESANGYIYSKKSNFLSWILLSESSIKPTYIRKEDITESTASMNAESNSASKILDEEKISVLEKEFTERFNFRYPSSDAALIPAKLSVSELYPTILDDYDNGTKLTENKKAKMRLPRFIDESEANGAAIGTATHQFMQFCDFNILNTDNIDAEIQRLTNKGFLSPSVSALVSRLAVKRFIESKQFESLKDAKDIKRELRFNVHLKASSFTEPGNDRSLDNETVLVQGIIDCLYVDKNGETVLLDYKTDSIPRGMTQENAKILLIERHFTQLSYYAAACRSIIGKPIDKVVIYSFALGRSIEIPKERLLTI